MYITMRLTSHLEQRVTQLLKQELTLELRLVLVLLLAMLRHLPESHAFSYKQLSELQAATAGFSEDDHYAVAHEFVRQTRSWEAELTVRMLRFALLQEENTFGVLFHLTEAMRSKLETQNVK